MLLLVDCHTCRLLLLIFINFKFLEFSQEPVEILCLKLVYNVSFSQVDRKNSLFGIIFLCIFDRVSIIFNLVHLTCWILFF